MVNLKAEWFNQSPRNNIEQFVTDRLLRSERVNNDLGTFNDDDISVIYKVACSSAESTILLAIRYLAVHPTHSKPWICRTQIKHPLELEEFREYIDRIKKWLNKQPPTQHYGSLVYMQALTKLLNTMEITNG